MCRHTDESPNMPADLKNFFCLLAFPFAIIQSNKYQIGVKIIGCNYYVLRLKANQAPNREISVSKAWTMTQFLFRKMNREKINYNVLFWQQNYSGFHEEIGAPGSGRERERRNEIEIKMENSTSWFKQKNFVMLYFRGICEATLSQGLLAVNDRLSYFRPFSLRAINPFGLNPL